MHISFSRLFYKLREKPFNRLLVRATERFGFIANNFAVNCAVLLKVFNF